ncbi:hypothetical protein PHLGIDRAFT_127636 [Phlebiopsis gigantea 11061_1 CR5-6]|uniref:Cytochrome c oxidase subunit 8, mitochondrial n=1 Tax=Phlebiopsis gigantea (strain 11061_1 CR5-6) TaxID=745531 RepID=A0A0C3NQJ3_PHLG1|nr:hypothetical protein PHLGIDRAFT_127636 [Phlebiopsis gigantea 11061_1 CR5-6]
MSLTRLSSTVLRSPQFVVRGVRHSSGHPGGHQDPHLPFTFKKRKTFVAKLAGFVTVGFGLPFLTTRYSLSKSAGTV